MGSDKNRTSVNAHCGKNDCDNAALPPKSSNWDI